MLQTLFVYITLVLIMFCCGCLSALQNRNANPFRRLETLFPILLFTLVFGLRYDVGTDYINYLELYQTGNGINRLEFGFRFILDLFAGTGLHYSFFFLFFAGLQIYLLYLSFKDEQWLYPWLVFILFTGGFFLSWMNVIRQSIAVVFFIYAIKYIEEKRFWNYVFICLLASLFHKTGLVLIVFYPILKNGKDYFKNIDFQLLAIFIVIILYYSDLNIERLFSFVYETFANLFHYDNYTIEGAIKNIKKGNTGLGFIVSLLIDIIIILNSKRIKLFFNSSRINIFYNLYFIGVFFRILFAGSIIFLRPFLYFTYIKHIIAAYALYYLFKNRKSLLNQIFLFSLILLHLIYFSSYFFNGEEYKSLFRFFWQGSN
ncbi:EpsG family protein [anaerobic digester metagenome]